MATLEDREGRDDFREERERERGARRGEIERERGGVTLEE